MLISTIVTQHHCPKPILPLFSSSLVSFGLAMQSCCSQFQIRIFPPSDWAALASSFHSVPAMRHSIFGNVVLWLLPATTDLQWAEAQAHPGWILYTGFWRPEIPLNKSKIKGIWVLTLQCIIQQEIMLNFIIDVSFYSFLQ